MRIFTVVFVVWLASLSQAADLVCHSGMNPVEEVLRVAIVGKPEDGLVVRNQQLGGADKFGSYGEYNGKKLYVSYTDYSQALSKNGPSFRIDAVASANSKPSNVVVSSTAKGIHLNENLLDKTYLYHVHCFVIP